MLDAQDPAFGAVKLWVDTNQNALVDAGEQFELGQLQLSSIDFSSGHIRYSNGQAQALHTTALESDTDGVQYSKIVIQEEGKDLDAGFIPFLIQ